MEICLSGKTAVLLIMKIGVVKQPNNHLGKQDCMEINSYPGKEQHDKWNDIQCDITNRADGFVCKKRK